ncbi:MAG TPA: TonB family protein [Vicinamibacteria bacterium]|nr:TonB family protein [Vicinamibacteria bacterium]
MKGRMFEDLVVSAPPAGRFGRRATVLPLSIAAHAAALGAALLFPVLGPENLPDPAPGDIVWRVPVPRTPPPTPATPAPTRVARVPESRMPSRGRVPDPEPVTPAPAAGPIVSMIDPTEAVPEDGPAPCFFNCDRAAPGGTGDGPDGPPGGTEGQPGGGGTGLVRPGGDIKPPVRTFYVAPVYPTLAQVARAQGLVVVECTIDPSGRVVDVRVITGHPLLQRAALDAIRQWRYTPTRLNGVPVAVLMTVTVNFTLTR